MIPKQDLLELMQKEFQTTEKVMQAYPADKMELSPHERSNNAAALMRTFVFELHLMDKALGGEVDFNIFKTYTPADAQTIIKDFTDKTTEILAKVEQLSDSDLEKTTNFAGKDFPVGQNLLMLTHDQIHHRGQLTVYIRLAGGKVPSIYGPSADDQSTNL